MGVRHIPSRLRAGRRVLALACLIAAACSPRAERETPERVIWIAIDSLAAQRLGYMGYPRPTSPWLDEYAAESVVFEGAIAPSNVTPRSVAATMTGRPYSHLQRDLYEHRVPDEATTLAEWFRELGFRTTGFNSNPLLRDGTGFSQGFDAYHDVIPEEELTATLEQLIAAVRTSYQATGGPEYIYLHTMDVHHPYTPPATHSDLFLRADYAGTAVVGGRPLRTDGSRVFGNLPYFAASQRVGAADIDHLLGLHEGAIHYTDRFLPDLLAALHFDPASDLLVLSADHGEQFFEHGYWAHGRTLMPEEIHVPLLVRWDGFPARRVRAAVSLVDWFPTFADLFSAAVPEGLTGRSLLPALQGEPLAERPVYTEGHAYDALGAAVVANGHLYWLCADNSKITPWVEWPYAEVLCDLRTDPRCERDLSVADRQRTEGLNRILRETNPVWRSFTSEAMRSQEGVVRYGPQLLRDVPLDDLSIHADAPPLRLHATLDEPSRLHLVSLDYRLSSGVLDIILQAGSQGPVWRHWVVHPTQEWQPLRAKLRPGAAELVLRVRARAGGQAEVRSPQLRRLHGPELPIHVWPEAFEPSEQAAPLSEHEKDRLRALGYLE